MIDAWEGFNEGAWQREINVRDFIQENYTPYHGDSSFLCGPTKDTISLWNEIMELKKKEIENGGVLDMDTDIVSTITSHEAGYINKNKEKIVGLQTDKPLKRPLHTYGGIRMSVKACRDHGYEISPEVISTFTDHRKTHNAGVFDAYTP
jgi:formate C-acetyltransferase